MNILFITPIYPSSHSIKGAFVQEQAQALSKFHNVYVVVFGINKKFSFFFKHSIRKERKDNLTIYRISVHRSYPFYSQFNNLLLSWLEIRKIFKHKNIDIVHAHFAHPAGFLGVFIKKLLNVPLVITEHASSFDGMFLTFVHKYLAMKAYKKADKIIAVGKDLSKELHRLTHREIEIIPNVININKFEIKTERNDTFNIGFLGHLDSNRKGLDVLLEAAVKVKNQNFTLHIGGGGTMERSFRKMANELGILHKVRFYGEMPTDRVPAFFTSLDFFVLSSRKESFGVVLLEAMACGMPVIATICGGPENFVTKETGILVENENIEELKDAIDYIIDNYASYDKMKIREYVDTHFGVNVFSNRMTEIYNQLLID